MGVSKVVYGSNTLIDLTGDTITAADLMQGVTAHGADGEAITGTYVPSTETETLLWTNPSPTTARSSLDATLSDSLQNYKKVKIKYSYNTSPDGAPFFAIFPIFYEKDIGSHSKGDYIFDAGTTSQRMCIGLNNASGNAFVRQAYVSNDTTIHFNNAYRVNTSGSTNSNLIPVYIYGIK